MSARPYAVLLGALALVFAGRVLGQAIVAVAAVPCLPPMQAWYSGLIPYPVLLPIQLVILAVQAKVTGDIARGSGWFATRRPLAGTVLRRVACLYALGMALRWVLTDGTRLPIVFHWVLASHLFVLGAYHAGWRSLFAQYAQEGLTVPGELGGPHTGNGQQRDLVTGARGGHA